MWLARGRPEGVTVTSVPKLFLVISSRISSRFPSLNQGGLYKPDANFRLGRNKLPGGYAQTMFTGCPFETQNPKKQVPYW